jgi:hypothetical protein
MANLLPIFVKIYIRLYWGKHDDLNLI